MSIRAGDLLSASTTRRADLLVIHALASVDRPMDAAEVRRRTGLARGTADRMLVRMVERGLLVRERVLRPGRPSRWMYTYQVTPAGREAVSELRESPVVGRLSPTAVDVLDTLACARGRVDTMHVVEDTGRSYVSVRNALRHLARRQLVRQTLVGRMWWYQITARGRQALQIVQRRSA